MLSISSGHSAAYLTDQVAKGRESYYLDATTEGEPPGRWWGSGAEAFGLSGEVDHQDMHALYALHLDPRDTDRWGDQSQWSSAPRLGRAPGKYRSADEILDRRLADGGYITAERLAEIRAQLVDGDQGDAQFRRLILAEAPGLIAEDLDRMTRQAGRETRQPVSFVDATFSVPKSVTVLHTSYARQEIDAQRAGDEQAAAQWAARRLAVEDAIWQGNRAMLSYLSERGGYSRSGRHGAGAGRWVDAHDWTVASFFQHTSRDHDPQLHIHNAILNRVVCADGEVRTLDSQAIHRLKQAAGTIGDRAMETALSASLDVRWVMRADQQGREVAGVDQAAMDLFSERSGKISKKAAALVDAFRAHHGREPSGIELDRIRRQATMATRQAKTHDGETLAERLDRWDTELRSEVAGGLRRVAESVGEVVDEPAPAAGEGWSLDGVCAEAVARVQESRAAWGRSELIRQLLIALPDDLGVESGQVAQLAESLADRVLGTDAVVQVSGAEIAAVPAALRVADGRSAYAAPTGPRYASRAHVVAEQALRRAAVERGRRAADTETVDRWLSEREAAGLTLGEDQRAAVRGILTSGAAVSVLVGPAGAGKSWTLGALSEAWRSPLWADGEPGRLVGLAVSQIATEVLRDEGLTACNVAQWTGAQRRIAAGTAARGDWQWSIRPGDAVVVDEASMVTTGDLDLIREAVDQAGARLILTGDPRQLAAVGAGGAMAMLAAESVDRHTLTEVRRFRAEWERASSLRLRDGDAEIVAEYDRRGRVLDAGTSETAGARAAVAWLGDTLAGRRSIVVVPSNAEAAAISATIRDELVSLGRVAADGVILGRDGNAAGVGDLVQARRNDRQIGVTNRRRYVVRDVIADGSLIVEPEDGGEARTLPAAYVEADVTLGYASTAHAAQGVTVDTAHGVVSDAVSPEALYVLMTRGRERNTAYVVTEQGSSDVEPGGAVERRRAVDVLVDVVTGEAVEAAAIDQAAAAEEQARSLHTIHARIEDAVRLACADRLGGWLDELHAAGELSDGQREALAADQGTEQLSRLLRAVELAGGDAREALSAAVTGRTLDGSRSLAQVLHHRITTAVGDRLVPDVEHLGDRLPAGVGDEWTEYLGELVEASGERRRQLGAEAAEQRPAWAEALGPVPDDVVARADWEHRAGLVAAHREATGWTDGARPIGPAPGLSSTERQASWHAAWRALGRPEAGAAEADLSEGQLRVRVRAAEAELAWAPKWVDDELRATEQAAEAHRQEAAILAARADAAADPDEAEQLRSEAQQRAALAEVMAGVAQGLDEAAEARAAWWIETAATREAGERARAELAARGRDIGAEPDRVTAAEWLADQQRHQADEDAHREVTEVDVIDDEIEAARVELSADVNDQAEAEPVREAVAASEPDRREDVDELSAGVPSPAETAAAVAAARLALDRVADRRSEADARAAREAAEQADRETAWRARDAAQAAERARQAEQSASLGI